MATKFFRFPFGISGDRIAIPETTDPSGAVSYQQGWGFDYERDPLSDPLAKNIPRDESNQLYYDITNALRQYQTHGVPDFITTSDNGGTAFPYDKNAKVLYDDGSGIDIFTSLVNTNTALPSDATKWRKGEGGITNLIGDGVANGPGIANFTLSANSVKTANILAQNVTLAKIAAQADNTILGNNTGGSASPVAIAIAASRLFGRGSSGGIGEITVSNDFTFLANQLAFSISQNQAQNGFVRLPGGLIIQWGVTSVAAYQTQVVSYPTAFPTNAFTGVASCTAGITGSANFTTYFEKINLSTFRVFNPSGAAQNINWIAIGN